MGREITQSREWLEKLVGNHVEGQEHIPIEVAIIAAFLNLFTYLLQHRFGM